MNCGGSCLRQETRQIPEEILEKTSKHPCYSFDSKHKYARMHLPVAPKCNISCNYCYRKYDCVNESRPGVTSEVLSPESAFRKVEAVREKIDNLSVIGIAGPGDALANWEDTKKTIELIKGNSPETIFCLSTNGLMLPHYASEIVALGINHVTVTMNCIDPEIGAKIYKYVIYEGRKLQGIDGARVLLENQLKGIRCLAEKGVLVKVNSVMIKDINDSHIPQIVKKVKELGAFITNIMPLIPAPGSAFENYPQTSTRELNQMRDICQSDMPQMRHCMQCRADAIGLLGEDRSYEYMGAVSPSISESISGSGDYSRIYKIAVASRYGKLVDQHFGHVSEFRIYQGNGSSFEMVETRQVEKYCSGVEDCGEEEARREKVISALTDCDAVLTMRIGYHAKQKLIKNGIISVESCDTVENGLVQAVEVLAKKEIA